VDSAFPTTPFMGMRQSGLSLAQQALALRSFFPAGKVELGADTLKWVGQLTPTEVSRIYTVQVVQRLRGMPQVRVVSPKLEARPGESLPHVYSDGTLCLHLANEWRRGMPLAQTIVPWSSEWLAFYEIWKVTGDWEGGGEWPPAVAAGGGK